MKIKNLKTLLLVFTSICFFACSDDENNKFSFDDDSVKAIVINEGNMGSGNTEISLIMEDNSVINGAFGRANNGRRLGDGAQSLTIIDDKIFLAVAGSHKIEVLDKDSLKSLATIQHTDIVKPQYITKISDTEAAVSNFEKNHIVIFNTKTYEVTKTIATVENAKQMIAIGDKLFIAENGRIEVMSISSKQIEKSIDCPVTSNTKLIYANNYIWALCCKYAVGETSWSTIEPDGNAYLAAINPNTQKVEKKIELNKELFYAKKFEAKMELSNSGQEIYLLLWQNPKFKDEGGWMSVSGDLGIFSVSIKEGEENNTPKELFKIPSNIAMCYSFSVSPTGSIYICDVKDYTKNGVIREYTKEGKEITSYNVSIIPQYIQFVNE